MFKNVKSYTFVDMDKVVLTRFVKNAVANAGFDACGIAPVALLSDEAACLAAWLAAGYNAGMGYLAKHVDKRENPALLVENAKSVVVMLMNYKPAERQRGAVPKIACYAYGNDYHDLIRAKLHQIIQAVKTAFPPLQLRGFVDTAPVLEKAWAKRAGLGWIGKNNLLVSPVYGSFVFLSVLLLDAELVYNSAEEKDRCGNCTKCIDACPNKALEQPYLLNANKCISYHTIENKNTAAVNLHGYCFGCDYCQLACPWNKQSPAHQQAGWPVIPAILHYTADDWEHLDEQSFNTIFANSPIQRAGFHKFKSNIALCNYKQK